MAQLITKNSQWWAGNRKYIGFWSTIAAVQVSTLVGLGYFYNRLTALESPTPTQNDTTTSPAQTTTSPVQTTTSPVQTTTSPAQTTTSPAQTTTSPAQTTTSPAQIPDILQATMPIGARFNINTMEETTLTSTPRNATSPPPVATTSFTPTIQSKRPITKRQTVTSQPAQLHIKTPTEKTKNIHTTPTKTHTKSLNTTQVPPKTHTPTPISSVKKEKKQITEKHQPTKISSAPNIRTQDESGNWVYLGELRNYGWYDQKLHINPNSGLPQTGTTYRTQTIHGTYNAPQGRRSMGGYQQGDEVMVQQVEQASDGKVWAKVEKVRSVGRIDN